MPVLQPPTASVVVAMMSSAMMALTMATPEKGRPGTGPGLSLRRRNYKQERLAVVPALTGPIRKIAATPSLVVAAAELIRREQPCAVIRGGLRVGHVKLGRLTILRRRCGRSGLRRKLVIWINVAA